MNSRPERARSAVCAPLQGALLRRARALSPGKSRCRGCSTNRGRKPGDHGTREVIRLATDAEGRVSVENVPPGGPYTIEVHAPGYAAARVASIVLALGQRYRADFPLPPAAVQVGEVAGQR